MRRKNIRRIKSMLIAAVALGGGTVFESCATVARDAFVSGTKDYLFTGFFPMLIPTDDLQADQSNP